MTKTECLTKRNFCIHLKILHNCGCGLLRQYQIGENIFKHFFFLDNPNAMGDDTKQTTKPRVKNYIDLAPSTMNLAIFWIKSSQTARKKNVWFTKKTRQKSV